MNLTYQYKLLPEKRQRRFMEDILERQRNLYNYGLNQREFEYKQHNRSLSRIDQFKDLTIIRHTYKEYGDIPANLSRWTLDNLDKAMKAFFRRVRNGETPGYPRYKGKGRMRSFGFNEFSGITFENGRIKFKGMPGSLRILMHRPLPKDADITSCTFNLKCG